MCGDGEYLKAEFNVEVQCLEKSEEDFPDNSSECVVRN